MFGASIGRNVIIRPSVKIIYPWKLTIGDNSWIGDDVTLYTVGKIDIGHDTVISQKSYLCTGSHNYKSSSFDTFTNNIKIGNKVWVATDVYVAPGVTIEDGAIVAARSSVFRNLPKKMISMGSPAKPVKPRFDS